jgi:EAL domain-containing protein (putative c-di-GMP-specific phosphodiesterase class I)
VSVRQLREPAFIQDVRGALEIAGIDPSTLILEVTESVMMDNVDLMIARFTELKQLGVRLAIDDFGTGYSSLSYLRQFPFDILKVDKAFVDAGDEDDGKNLARGIIELGRTLHLQIVAEGIERADQVAALRVLECEMGQGFYFSEPLTGTQLDELLRERREVADAA